MSKCLHRFICLSSLLSAAAGLFISGVADASVRIDRPWVKARGQELCTPSNANQSWSCQREFEACEAEFTRMMDGTFYGFCQGQNPELCNTLAPDVYEFSNQGYGMLVVTPSDRFLFQNETLKTAYACVREKPEPIVISSQVLFTRSMTQPITDLFVNNKIAVLKTTPEGSVIVAPPEAAPPPPAAPEPPPEVVAAQPVEPVLQAAPVPVGEIPKPEAIQPPAGSTNNAPPVEVPQAPEPEPENVEAIVAAAEGNSNDNSRQVTPGFTGGGCSLQESPAVGSRMIAWLNLIFLTFPLRIFRRY